MKKGGLWSRWEGQGLAFGAVIGDGGVWSGGEGGWAGSTRFYGPHFCWGAGSGFRPCANHLAGKNREGSSLILMPVLPIWGGQNVDNLSRFRKCASLLGLFGRKSPHESPNFLRSRLWRSRIPSSLHLLCCWCAKNPMCRISMACILKPNAQQSFGQFA